MLAERAAHLDALAPMLVGAHFVQRRLTPPAYADGAFPLNTAFDLNESLKACGFRLDELEQQWMSPHWEVGKEELHTKINHALYRGRDRGRVLRTIGMLQSEDAHDHSE